MSHSRFMPRFWVFAMAAVVGTLGLAGAVAARRSVDRPAAMYFPLYEPQKVVYHVKTGGGWFGRSHRHLVTVAKNHLNAVGEGFLDLRIVLQGDGVDILTAAKSDGQLAGAIKALRGRGVRFLVCYNTLAMRRIDYQRDMYGVGRDDLVSAGVAEVAKLEKDGFVYLRL